MAIIHSFIHLNWMFNYLINDSLIIYALNMLGEAFATPIK